MNPSTAELVGVTKIFGANGCRTTAIENVSLRASRGELLLLLGPSGSGKTTLLTLLAGLLRPSVGEVLLFGQRLEGYAASELQNLRAKRLGFIFQNFLLVDALTVHENVRIVVEFGGIRGNAAAGRAESLIRQFGLERLGRKFPPELSQGEKQRVAIARAMANGGELILADEPTASLESSQGLEIIQILHALSHENGRCVVVASHDLRLTEYADRVVGLRDGRVSAE